MNVPGWIYPVLGGVLLLAIAVFAFPKQWGRVASVIAHVQARIILTLFYYVLVLPFALLMRATQDPLHIKASPGWIARPTPDATIDAMRRQG